MSTWINKIVQTTRRMNAIEQEMHQLTREERPELEAKWQAEYDERFRLTLAAIKDGVEPDLIEWAMAMQTPLNQAVVELVIAALKLAAIEEQEAGA